MDDHEDSKVSRSPDDEVSVDELSFILVSLGLAADKKFVMRIMRMLAPKKFLSGKFDGSNLTSKEFSQLFKTDVPNDKMAKLLKTELQAEDMEKQKKIIEKSPQKSETLKDNYYKKPIIKKDMKSMYVDKTS